MLVRGTGRRKWCTLSTGALAAALLVASPGGTAPAPVSVGVLAAMTGVHADVGAAILEGARVAQRAINEAGGILGRTMEIHLADTQSDAADAVPAENKLIGANRIVVQIGPTSTELFAVRPIIDNNRIPMIFLGGTTVFDTNEDQWIWRPNPSDSQLSVAMALYAIKKGYRNAALVFYTDITNETLKAPIVKTFQKLGGKIVADVKLTAGQTSYRSEVERVVSAHPDVIFTQTDPGTAAVMYANFKELNNLGVPLIGTDLTAGSNYIKSVTPQVANKVLVSLVGSTPPGAAADAFAALYAKLYTHEPLESSNYAYDGTIVMALAIQKAGGTDPEKIVASLPLVTNPGGAVVYTYRDGLAGLTSGKRIKYYGASGPMVFDKYHNAYGPFDVVQAGTDGKLRTLVTISADEIQKAAQ
ncbi:MAG: amino acid ABC transporter substrate-binding protein [Bacillati bacterium ANGP1]|uniref:Amino acid ABC transporter substrate-binding protein n=1 Tax=Candidatus Segetimicrobium genomatis TaxID=2569760 RepID=A0A537J545_9BACT|nr:MAG: amino acid ABC transporter substrate-binding protein [Terrabacteria group bacterium ANGP1]